MLDFIQGVVDPRDGHPKCPRGAKSLKGGMGGNFEILCRRGHTILLASDTMRLTDLSRKLSR